MAEDYLLTRTAEVDLTEQLEGRRRAERLEEILWQVLHRVAQPGEVNLLVLDMGKGECLVALRQQHNLIQVRFWRDRTPVSSRSWSESSQEHSNFIQRGFCSGKPGEAGVWRHRPAWCG
jgi:hypothetical protein